MIREVALTVSMLSFALAAEMVLNNISILRNRFEHQDNPVLIRRAARKAYAGMAVSIVCGATIAACAVTAPIDREYAGGGSPLRQDHLYTVLPLKNNL